MIRMLWRNPSSAGTCAATGVAHSAGSSLQSLSAAKTWVSAQNARALMMTAALFTVSAVLPTSSDSIEERISEQNLASW